MPFNVQPIFERLYKDPHYLALAKKKEEAFEALEKADKSGDLKAIEAADEKFMQLAIALRRYEKDAGVPH
jgi:hypothetical protein